MTKLMALLIFWVVYIAGALMFLIGSAKGQEAPVINLSPADSAQARKAYDDLKAAKARWADLQETLSRKYLIVTTDDPEAGAQYDEDGSIKPRVNCNAVVPYSGKDRDTCNEMLKNMDIKPAKTGDQWKRQGFEGEESSINLPKFEFSRDFKYIVPKAKKAKEEKSHITIDSGGMIFGN